MKPKRSNPLFAGLFRKNLLSTTMVLSFGLGATSGAQTLYWDTSDAAGSGNAGGVWDSGTNWTEDSSGTTTPRVGWTEGRPAVFSAGTDGTGAWTVTIIDSVTTPSILVDDAGGKTISGGTINIGGGIIDTVAAGSGNTFTISSVIAGSGGISVAANGDTSASGGGFGGRLVLSGTNTFVGDLTITSGLVRANSNFGDAGNKVILNGGGLLDDNQNINFTRNIQVDAGGGVYRTYGSVATGQISGAITGTGILRHTDGGTITLVGNGSGFSGEFFNQRGTLRLGTSGNWANASFRSEDASSTMRFLTGVSEYKIKEYFGDRDMHIEAGVTLNIVGGNFNVSNGDAVNNFWVQNSGSLTSESNTLNCNWGTTDYLSATDRAIRVIIKDYTVGSPLTLVKNQAGGLILDKANTYTGGTIINAGRIQVDNTGALGAVTGSVTVNSGGQAYLRAAGTYAYGFVINGNGSTEGSNQLGAIRFENNTLSGGIQVASAARISAQSGTTGTHTGALTGSANLEINSTATGDSGTINLNGNASVYGGTLSISQGVVNINSPLFGGSVQVNDAGLSVRANLGAATTVSGSLTVADYGKLGGEGTVSGTLTLGDTVGTDIYVDASTSGALTAASLDIKAGTENFVYLDKLPVAPGAFTILKYTNLVAGDETNFNVQATTRGGGTPVVVHDTVNKQFTVDLGNALRTWDNGAATGSWNTTDANWVGGDEKFVTGDSVVFDDTPGSNQTIDLPSNVTPGSISFSNSSAVSYSINGAGGITGTTGVTKSGTGTASLGGTGNSYTGTVNINGGVLKALTTSALGATTTGTTVNGGTLDPNGLALGAETITIQGTGAAGMAAIYNGSTTTAASIGPVSLSGPATIGNAVAVADTAKMLSTGTMSLNGNKLTLSGGGVAIGLQNITSGDIDILNGGVLYSQNGGSLTSATGTITIYTGGLWEGRDSNNTTMTTVHDIVLNGGKMGHGTITGNNGGGGGVLIKNNIQVAAAGGIMDGTSSGFDNRMRLTGALTGSGPLTIQGGRGVEFRGNVSGYSGTFTVLTNLVFNGDAAQSLNTTVTESGTGARSFQQRGANPLNIGGSNISISNFQVGRSGGTEVIIPSGTTVTTKFVDVGTFAGGNSGKISQTGGLVSVAAGGNGVRIGHWNTGSPGSFYNLTGGTLDATGLAANATGSAKVVNIGWDGLGTMTVGGGTGSATLKAYGIQLDANGDSATYNNSLIVSPNGVVEVGAGNIVGASVNDGVFLNGGTLLATAATTLSAQTTLNPSTSSFIDADTYAITWSGPIAGSGSFDKSGTGALTMTAGGAFAGTATASEGRLYTGTATWTDATFASTSTGILQPATLAAAGTSTVKNLTFNGGSAAFRAKTTGGDQFAVTGNLTVQSATTLLVDTSGMTTGQQAVLIDYQGTIGGAAGIDGLTLVSTNPRAQISKIHNVGDTQILVSLDSVDSIVWSGSANSDWDLDTTSNWVLNSNNATSAKFLEYDMVRFTNFGVATRPNVTLVGTINPSSVEVSNTTGTYQLSGAAITGTGALTKTGSGGLTLSASNSYSGGTTIGGGTVTAAAANALGTGATTLNSGTLNLNHASALGSGVLTIAGGALGNTSGAPVTLTTNNAQSWTGDFVSTAAQPLNLGTGAVTLGATRQIIVTSADLTVGGVISGTGFGITKAGSGKLVLAGANSYDGTTTVNEGTLEVSANSGKKTYSVAAGATLRIGYSTGNADYNYGITVNGSGSAAASGLYIEGGDSLVLQNALTLATAPSTVRSYGTGNGTLRGWDVNGTHLNVQTAASGSVIDTGVTLNGSGYGYRMNVEAGSETATGDLIINGPMSGSANAGFANFRKYGAGSVLINTSATYAAGMDIRNGSVILGGNDRLPAGSYVVLGDGTASGKLKLNGNSQTLASISTTGTGTANAIVGGAATTSTLTVSNTAAVSFAGRLGGSGTDENNLNLVKAGAETLTLSGVSTFTGNTTVSAGALNLADNARLTFRLGATSGSNNTITGAGTVVLDGDFAIDTTAADGLTSGTWLLENVPSLDGAYGTSFQVVNTDGSSWTDIGGDQWTKPGVNPGQTWTFDETYGTLTLTTVAAGYDAWAAQIPDVNQRDRGDDPDSDGFTNLQEFLFGTNPMANTGALTTTERSGGNLIIRWNERLTGADYTLFESATLSNPWSVSSAPVTTDGSPVGDYQPMKATVTISAGRMFFRVEGAEVP